MYSIIEKAGDNLEAQMKLADWHLRRMREAEWRAQVLAEPMEAEIARLTAEVAAIRQEEQNSTEFHRITVEEWAREANLREVLGKTIPFPHGRIITRQTPGTTEVDEETVLSLYRNDPLAYGNLVRVVADKPAAREAGMVQVTDLETGEITEIALVRELEGPSIKYTIEVDGLMESDADSTDPRES